MTIYDQLVALFTTPVWWSYLIDIAIFYLLAWLVSRLTRPVAKRLSQLRRFTPPAYRPNPERQETLEGLISSAISIIAFILATLASIALFVSLESLVWMVALFATGFGLGARPLIGNILAGIRFIFEDIFTVGEKVEMLNVEGVVEAVSLQTTWLRSPSGELFVIPNGEVSLVRNFSRGNYSTANTTLKIATGDLNRTLPFLEELGQEAVVLLPNLLEPWQVISDDEVSGKYTNLTLLAKARFGRAAEMRPRLLVLVQERLADEGITLAD